ncbi:MAG: hypothetical protein IPG64_22945 [Haliea sp.]|nr:hypothetical protein [Haliea sp.]
MLLSSDNGGAGYIGLPEVVKPFRGWKMTPFEGGIHVPFFAKWPARTAPGTVNHSPVHQFMTCTPPPPQPRRPSPPTASSDGIDSLPYVLGVTGGAPHQCCSAQRRVATALVDGWKLNVAVRRDARGCLISARPQRAKRLLRRAPGQTAGS